MVNGPSTEQIDAENVATFSGLTREMLEQDGYRFARLTGKTALELQDEGLKLGTDRPRRFPEAETAVGHKTEVAYKPDDQFVIVGQRLNKNLDFEGYTRSVDHLSRFLGKKMPDVQAIIGRLPDYLELLFERYKRTNTYAFGYHQTTRLWTSTKREGVNSQLCVDNSYVFDTLHIRSVGVNKKIGFYVLPLLVPKPIA